MVILTIEEIERRIVKGCSPNPFDANWVILSRDEYMGSKDRNEREIYERDVIKTNWGTGQIIYEGDGFTLNLGGSRNLPDGSCRNFIEYKDNWQSWEVIGNIYENPELLK